MFAISYLWQKIAFVHSSDGESGSVMLCSSSAFVHQILDNSPQLTEL